MRKVPKIKKTCKICKKEYEVLPSRNFKSKFCSIVCFGKWETQQHQLERDFYLQYVLICQNCGKEFHVKTASGIRLFCSRKCASENLVGRVVPQAIVDKMSKSLKDSEQTFI